VQVGEFEVLRVVEWAGLYAPVADLFASIPRSAWEARPWLSPDHWDAQTGLYRCAFQTWVVHAGGQTILIDTGEGNDKHRPQVPMFDHLSTSYLDRLEAVVGSVADVDFVVNTHIHHDHVGWNTRLADGAWQPTFPRADYLVPADDLSYFDPDHPERMRVPETEDERLRFDGIHIVYRDSITPIRDRITPWDGSIEPVPGVRLQQYGGHTPGSGIVRIESAGESAVFVGDLLHTPLQVARPDDPVSFDLDPTAASDSRRRLLAQAAEDGSWVFPAHLPGRGGFTVVRDGDHFEIDRWAPFPTE
jgi:glyoxylase-like metal-dependent hydrolase (beta-lactamase superfamily II)